MRPEIDIFHQLKVKTAEGFVAITNYTEDFPTTHVYTPQGEWCGCSNASNELSLMAAIRGIVKNRIAYERRTFGTIHEAAEG